MKEVIWDRDVEIGGTSLRGILPSPWSFEETVARLVAASGQPPTSFDRHKVSVEFRGTFDGQVFTLYDYKADNQIHIGGRWSRDRGLDVAGLQEALFAQLQAVRPVSYRARFYYDGVEGLSHGWVAEDGWKEAR